MEVNDAYIESILSGFSVSLENYEIINLREFQGWSTTYLYLITGTTGDYILKGKNEQQFKGFHEEVQITQFLENRKKPVRNPIKRTDEDSYYIQRDGLYWCMLTFIPGAAAHIEEYTQETVKDLAAEISEYILLSMNQKEILTSLDLRFSDPQDMVQVFQNVTKSQNELARIIPSGIRDFNQWHTRDCPTCLNLLNDHKNVSIIHNDINPKNILFDHKSKKIICLIDWDHGCFGSPLKDIFDASAMFFDYLSPTVARSFSEALLASTDPRVIGNIEEKYFGKLFRFFYSYAKWKSILFYNGLLKEYGNKYGEEDRYIFEINSLYDKWRAAL